MCVCARSNAWTACKQDFAAAASKHHKAPTQICHRSRKPSSTKQSVHLNEHREVRDGMLFFLFLFASGALRRSSPQERRQARRKRGQRRKRNNERSRNGNERTRKATNTKRTANEKTKQNEPNEQNERTNKHNEAKRKQRTNERRPRRLRRKPPARLSAGGVRASPRSRPPPGPP